MVIIEGTAFPLDKINKNGWGIPSSEADNAISSLKNAVIRVCPRDSPHGCDLSEDPKAEIGRVLDVWKDGNKVKARADITDSIAAAKVEDGTWPKAWSVYAKAAAINNGWGRGIDARSLTLVTNPAWEDAGWEIAASGDDALGVHVLHSFSLIASVDDTMPNNNEPPADGDPTPEEKIAQLEQDIADKDKKIEDLEKTGSGLAASNKELGEKVKKLETLTASLEDDKTKMMPLEEVKTLVASESQKIAAAELDKYKEDLARTDAFEKLTAARRELDLETKAEDYQHLTASDLEKLAEDFGGIKVTAGTRTFQYPASDTGNSRIGVYNPTTGVFE